MTSNGTQGDDGTASALAHSRGRRVLAARAAVAAVVALLAVWGQPVGAARGATPNELGTEAITLRGSGGVELRGLLVAPESASPPRPGVVLVHGAGPHPGTDYLPEAEAFARAGIVALVYDKRTEGYSLLERSFATLADDALAAVRALRERPGVDPARVGLWGLSEGGWVAPLAASRSTDVAFLITVAGTGVPPARQEAWAKANRLRHAGVSGSLLWAYPVDGTRFAAGAGLFPEATYDPLPVLERLRQPLLAIWGEYDQLSPPAENVRLFREALERGGNPHATLRVLPGAEHEARRTPDGGFTRLAAFAPGYVELMTSWVNGLAAGPPASSADPPPRQQTWSVPLAALQWYESPPLQLAAVVLLVVACAGYAVLGVARRTGGHRERPPARGSARGLAATALSAGLGLYGYFGSLLLTNERALGPLVLGRPVPWLALQLLAVAAVITLAATGVATWRARADLRGWLRLRLGVLLACGVVFVPWAVYWGLLVP
jgi:dienelactone hydrolase